MICFALLHARRHSASIFSTNYTPYCCAVLFSAQFVVFIGTYCISIYFNYFGLVITSKTKVLSWCACGCVDRMGPRVRKKIKKEPGPGFTSGHTPEAIAEENVNSAQEGNEEVKYKSTADAVIKEDVAGI